MPRNAWGGRCPQKRGRGIPSVKMELPHPKRRRPFCEDMCLADEQKVQFWHSACWHERKVFENRHQPQCTQPPSNTIPSIGTRVT